MKTIGSKIKEARTDKELSRRSLIEKLKPLGVDVTEQTLINWENDITVPTADLIEPLAKALGVRNGFFWS